MIKFIVPLLFVLIIGCGKTDDNPTTPNNESNSLNGVWRQDSVENDTFTLITIVTITDSSYWKWLNIHSNYNGSTWEKDTTLIMEEGIHVIRNGKVIAPIADTAQTWFYFTINNNEMKISPVNKSTDVWVRVESSPSGGRPIYGKWSKPGGELIFTSDSVTVNWYNTWMIEYVGDDEYRYYSNFLWKTYFYTIFVSDSMWQYGAHPLGHRYRLTKQ
jgi:hypothetical protein